MKSLLTLMSSVLMAMAASSCSGIFDDIYDEVPSDDSFTDGFNTAADYPGHYVLMLDATSYSEWIYLDFHHLDVERLPIPLTLSEGDVWDGISGLAYQEVNGDRFTPLSFTPTEPQPAPAGGWDLAIHHFDVRTNGGSAAVTALSSPAEASASILPTLTFEPDTYTDNQVIVDMKEMMGFHIGYQAIPVNKVLTSWATMDFSTPPPVYSATGATYVVRLADGSAAAIKLLSYISPRGTKGYLTIDINYPLQ